MVNVMSTMCCKSYRPLFGSAAVNKEGDCSGCVFFSARNCGKRLEFTFKNRVDV